MSFRPNFEVRPVRIAPEGTQIPPGTAVTTVGCNRGENPSAIESRVTANNRYQGPPNTEVAGAPVEGRSGGGLFNDAGQLVGVCFAADHEEDEGLYAGLKSVHELLDSRQLSDVYQGSSPSMTTAGQTEVRPALRTAGTFSVRGQQPQLPSHPLESAPSSSQTGGVLSLSEQAALEEIRQRGTDSEVICIIRPRDPGGKSEVITLPNASGAFVEALTKEPGAAAAGDPRVTAAAAERLLR